MLLTTVLVFFTCINVATFHYRISLMDIQSELLYVCILSLSYGEASGSNACCAFFDICCILGIVMKQLIPSIALFKVPLLFRCAYLFAKCTSFLFPFLCHALSYCRTGALSFVISCSEVLSFTL